MTIQRPAIIEIIRNDPRFPYEAYEFLFEALTHAQRLLGRVPDDGEFEPSLEHHVSGPELVHGVIDFARQEFGLLARVVFHQWGIRRSDDIGEIVFNLHDAELLLLTESDHRSDFHNVCDLDRSLSEGFAIQLSDSAPGETRVAMKAARIRLVIAVVAFVGWLGYLGFLALATPRAVLVSRSQLLLATQIVKAEVSLDEAGKPNTAVRVLETLSGPLLSDETITIENLNNARLLGNRPVNASGAYLFLLERTPLKSFRVVGAPSGVTQDTARPSLVYPWNAEVERQIRDWLAAK